MTTGRRHNGRAGRAKRVTELGPKAQAARARALHALNLMRRRGWSLAAATAEVLTTPRTARKYVSDALRRQSNGRYAAEASDRLYRELRFLTPDGMIVLGVNGSRKAEAIARYWAAVHSFLTGDAGALRSFEARSLRVGKSQYRYVTDPTTLERLAYAGELGLPDIYAIAG